MRIVECLRQSETQLAEAGIGTARLDALVLMEDVTGRDRAWLLAHPEHALSPGQVEKLEKLLKRRAMHEPLAYIRGRTEFYGREFVLTSAVLEPRPESETMINLLKDLAFPRHSRLGLESNQKKKAGGAQNGLDPSLRWDDTVRIADVGAGSGALGITAALELPSCQVELLEVDPQAIKVAKTNVDKFTLNIDIIESDLLERSSKDYDVLLCNLPYVPDGHTINQAAVHEPKIAIFGGPDGLDVYRKLFKQVQKLKKQPLYILTESLPPQHSPLKAIAQQSGYRLTKTDDFIQLFASSERLG